MRTTHITAFNERAMETVAAIDDAIAEHQKQIEQLTKLRAILATAAQDPEEEASRPTRAPRLRSADEIGQKIVGDALEVRPPRLHIEPKPAAS